MNALHAVFHYFSTCCNELADKPACKKVDKKEALTQGLGTWRCTKCRRVATVTRQPNTPTVR